MALNSILAHRIDRATTSIASTVIFSDAEWQQTETSDACFRELKQTSLKRSGKEYGCLRDDHPFKQALTELYNENITLHRFSELALTEFKTHLDNSEACINHHIVIADEALESARIMHLYFLKQEPAHLINTHLALEQTPVLNTTIQFGLKINISELLSNDEEAQKRSVTLYKNRSDKILNTFLEQTTGFGDKKDIASDTEALLETVNHYTKTMPNDVASFTQHQVVNYCLEQEKSGEPVAIKALSNELAKQFDDHQQSFSTADSGSYTPPPKFENFVSENQPEIKKELIADKNKLKNFIRISGRNEQMSMSFSSSCLGDSVVYDPSTDSLIVKSIPSSLKARLIKVVQGSHEE